MKPVLVILVILFLALAFCGGEEPPPDDGTPTEPIEDED